MRRNHNFYSNLAFNIAERNLGKTSRNPSVGCVIVKDNSVISSAVTSVSGRPHAEFNALNKNLNFKDSNMYVTLEPCTHYGVTPPCINIIKKKKIKNVFFSFEDPDERTNKKVKKYFKKSFKLRNINNENKDFYKSYFLNRKHKFPLIDAKLATSKDLFTISKNSKWITNLRSRKVGQLLRSKYDCILSTSDSINKDNSLLNCRIDGLNNFKPDLIIIDRGLKLKRNLKLFNLCKKRKTYILTTSKDKNKISFFKKKKIRFIKINKLNSKYDFNKIFRKLYQIGKGRILVESGLVFLNELFKFKLVNNLYLFKTNKFLKSNGYNNTNNKFLKRFKLKNKIEVNLDNNELFKIRIK